MGLLHYRGAKKQRLRDPSPAVMTVFVEHPTRQKAPVERRRFGRGGWWKRQGSQEAGGLVGVFEGSYVEVEGQLMGHLSFFHVLSLITGCLLKQ